MVTLYAHSSAVGSEFITASPNQFEVSILLILSVCTVSVTECHVTLSSG